MAHRPVRRVTAAEVARRAGVSPATVSYVLNGRHGVSDQVRRQILQIAVDLEHPAALRINDDTRSKVLGLILTDLANPFYTALGAGTIDAARAAGNEVFVAHTQEDPDTLRHVVDAMIARRVDGVVIAVLHPDNGDIVRRMRSARLPFVQLSRRIPLLQADFVGIDDRAAGQELMHHVLDHGHREVAVLAGPPSSSASTARTAGFRAALADRGVPLTTGRLVYAYLDEDGGHRAIERVLASGTPPTAVVCGSDAIAAGALGALGRHGLRVPEDIAVTGFDGVFPDTSVLGTLTTIRQPHAAMAAAAVTQLIRRIDGSGGPPHEDIHSHQLRLRTSCGCQQSRKESSKKEVGQ